MTSRDFGAYRHPFKMVPPFKYLGRVLSTADDDWPKVVQKLVKAQTVWRRIPRILSREGERLRASGFLFKAFI